MADFQFFLDDRSKSKHLYKNSILLNFIFTLEFHSPVPKLREVASRSRGKLISVVLHSTITSLTRANHISGFFLFLLDDEV